MFFLMGFGLVPRRACFKKLSKRLLIEEILSPVGGFFHYVPFYTSQVVSRISLQPRSDARGLTPRQWTPKFCTAPGNKCGILHWLIAGSSIRCKTMGWVANNGSLHNGSTGSRSTHITATCRAKKCSSLYRCNAPSYCSVIKGRKGSCLPPRWASGDLGESVHLAQRAEDMLHTKPTRCPFLYRKQGKLEM